MQELTPEIAKTYGYGDEKGVVISKIELGTPAAWAGIKKGALIMAVNQKKITNVQEFNKAKEQTAKGKPLLLLIKQGDNVRFISLQLG